MQRELDQLAPVFEASKTDVQLRHEAVEACQKEYAAAKDRCKKQEQDIEGMQGPIEILKREAQAEFEKVNITILTCITIVLWNIGLLEDQTRSRTWRFPPERALSVKLWCSLSFLFFFFFSFFRSTPCLMQHGTPSIRWIFTM